MDLLEKIVAALKKAIADPKSGKTSVSDKTLQAYAKIINAQITDETEIEAAIVPAVEVLKEFQGNIDSVAADAVKNAVKKPDPKKTEDPNKKVEDENEDADMTPAMKKLFGLVETLSSDLKGIKGEKIATSRMTKLNEALAEAPTELKSRYTKDLNRMNFETEDDYDVWLTETKTDIETFVNAANAKGAVFTVPKGGQQQKANDIVSPEVAERAKERTAETVPSAIMGLPTK